MASSRRFGTFEGVFTPTILTILGAIMYLRLGWVVGNAGFGGALVIILLAKLVTVTTGLAIASMASNVRIGAGGSYAIISRSLGLEIGGAVGIPLYLSQALGGAMYIIGFTEAWMALFPQHMPLQVAGGVLLFLLAIALISAKVAMKFQFIIMALISASLVSFFLGKGDGSAEIALWGGFESAPFWTVFAIFFPAVTGIEAGAAMSGDLKDPKRSLSTGILGAIGISFVVYVALAFWMDHAISPELLRSNYTVMMNVSKWRPVVAGAVLGATLSSALGSLVGGPRTLMALGQHHVLPFGKILGQQSVNGEPRIATLITGIIIAVGVFFGNLNTIAPLLTMFFLITYGTINLVVFIEKQIGISSYRPTFEVPAIVPFIGFVWCTIAMFLINPLFAGGAIVVIIGVYLWLVREGLQAPWGDVRSGIFTAIAEWAIRMGARVPAGPKSWKPNLVVPVEQPEAWRERMDFIRDIIFPRGSVRIFSVKILERGVRHRISHIVSQMIGKKRNDKEPESESVKLEEDLAVLIQPLREEGLLAVSTLIEANHFLHGISVVTQSLKGMPLPPNVMFLTMSNDPEKDDRLEQLISMAMREKFGLIVLNLFEDRGFGRRKDINMWLRSGSPNRNLSILTAIQLEKNWNGQLRLLRMIEDETQIAKAKVGLEAVARRGRLPLDCKSQVLAGSFPKDLKDCPSADINIFGISNEIDVKAMHTITMEAGTTCLFIRDSGQESALA